MCRSLGTRGRFKSSRFGGQSSDRWCCSLPQWLRQCSAGKRVTQPVGLHFRRIQRFHRRCSGRFGHLWGGWLAMQQKKTESLTNIAIHSCTAKWPIALQVNTDLQDFKSPARASLRHASLARATGPRLQVQRMRSSARKWCSRRSTNAGRRLTRRWSREPGNQRCIQTVRRPTLRAAFW